MSGFDPNEPRGSSGQWIKLAQGLKRLAQEDQDTIVKAMGELPQGGQGNRVSIKGVEIRRHRSGGVRVKIGGEARHYESHEEAAGAVIRREHGMPSTGKGSGPGYETTEQAYQRARQAGSDQERAARYSSTSEAYAAASAQAKAPGGRLGGSGRGPSGGVTGKRRGEMGQSDEAFRAMASQRSDARRRQALEMLQRQQQRTAAVSEHEAVLKAMGREPGSRAGAAQVANTSMKGRTSKGNLRMTSRGSSLDESIKQYQDAIARMGGYEKAAQTEQGRLLMKQLQQLTAKRLLGGGR